MSSACGKQYRREILQGPPVHDPRASSQVSSSSLLAYSGHQRRRGVTGQVDLLLASRICALCNPFYGSVWDGVFYRYTGYAPTGKASVSPHQMADQLCAFCTSRGDRESNSSRINTLTTTVTKHYSPQLSHIRFNDLILFLVRNVSLSNTLMRTTLSHLVRFFWAEFCTKQPMACSISATNFSHDHILSSQEILLGESLNSIFYHI